MKTHLLIFGVCLVPTLIGSNGLAQTSKPTLADACKNYQNSMALIKSPRIPFPVAAGVIEQTKDQAKMCETPAPSKVDAEEVQDAANKVAVAAAPYEEIKQ